VEAYGVDILIDYRAASADQFDGISEMIAVVGVYRVVYGQLHPPPLASAVRFQIRYSHPISLNCHQLYIVIVAKPYAWLQQLCFWQSAFFRSVVIFINIVRFPPIQYY